MLDRKKESNIVCSSTNSPSNLVNNVFSSLHYLRFNIKLLFLTPKILEVSLNVSKSSEHCRGDFLTGGENLRRNDFDDSKIFSKLKLLNIN